MTLIKYNIAGKEVHPQDFQDLVVNIDYLNQKKEPSIDIENLTFKGADGTFIKSLLFSGINGGTGVFEAVPASVELSDGGTSKTFNCYLDFTNNLEVFGASGISASLKKEQGTDWLNEVANGFSYRYLYEIGVITDSDFVDVPYVINYIPDGLQLLFLAQATFTLSKELFESIKAIGERVADLTNAATPVVGVSVGVGAGVVTAFDIGDVIAAALKLTLQIAYSIGIAIAIGSLISQIIEQLMPPIRYHKGMPLRLLFQRACDYLNLTLSSTLLDSLDNSSNKYVYLPQKGQRGGTRPTGAAASWKDTGIPTQGVIFDTFAGVITTYKDLFNADFKLVDGTFFFERRDNFTSSNSYVIPNTFTNQEKLEDNYSLNTNEILSNYNINFATDIQDQNTLDNQEGRVFQVQTKPKLVGNQKYVTLKGARVVSPPLALATRKNELTLIETIVKALATAADFLTGQLGRASSLSGKINNRIGSMNLSSDFVNTDKLIVLSGNKLKANQRTELNAGQMWYRYHFINSFAPINGVHNQFFIYKDKPIPFSFEDFVSLSNAVNIETEDGERAEIEKINWNVYEGTATIDYRVNRLYTDNLEIVEL